MVGCKGSIDLAVQPYAAFSGAVKADSSSDSLGMAGRALRRVLARLSGIFGAMWLK